MTTYLETYKADVYDTLDIEGYVPDVQGWVNQGFQGFMKEALQKMKKPDDRRVEIIEVGSWKGLSTLQTVLMAQQLSMKVRIIAVDTWLGSPEFYHKVDDPLYVSLKKVNGYPSLYYTFVKNVKYHKMEDSIVPFPLPSDQAYEVMKNWKHKADIVYVDAAHEEDPVFKDICHFWELLHPGGVMIGDDWAWPGVKAAVIRFSTENKVEYREHGHVWTMTKPKLL